MAAETSLAWLIEIGHSRLKVAAYVKGEIGPVSAMPPVEFDEWLKTALKSQAQPACAWLCAVPEDRVIQPVLSALHDADIETRRVGTDSVELCVGLAYTGLGVDRWLALQPVWQRFKSAFVLVDCGTATTIDFIDETGVHQGGWILPGRDASRYGLIECAPGLKRQMIEAENDRFVEPAKDTVEAIERGLILQQAGAIELALQSLQASTDQLIRIVLTGGDAKIVGPAVEAALSIRARCIQNTSVASASALESRLEPIWTAPDLVLEGLSLAVEKLR